MIWHILIVLAIWILAILTIWVSIAVVTRYKMMQRRKQVLQRLREIRRLIRRYAIVVESLANSQEEL